MHLICFLILMSLPSSSETKKLEMNPPTRFLTVKTFATPKNHQEPCRPGTASVSVKSEADGGSSPITNPSTFVVVILHALKCRLVTLCLS